MAKCKYTVKENTRMGTHSFYAHPELNGKLEFQDLLEEACENTSIEISIMRAAVTEYMKAVKRNVLKGFRCDIGDNFLTVYPNIYCSVKDELNPDGTVKTPADPKKVNARNAVSKLGASVSKKFSNEFAMQVSWQKVTAGTEINDDEVIDETGLDTEAPEPSGGSSGGNDDNPDGIE